MDFSINISKFTFMLTPEPFPMNSYKSHLFCLINLSCLFLLLVILNLLFNVIVRVLRAHHLFLSKYTCLSLHCIQYVMDSVPTTWPDGYYTERVNVPINMNNWIIEIVVQIWNNSLIVFDKWHLNTDLMTVNILSADWRHGLVF